MRCHMKKEEERYSIYNFEKYTNDHSMQGDYFIGIVYMFGMWNCKQFIKVYMIFATPV